MSDLAVVLVRSGSLDLAKEAVSKAENSLHEATLEDYEFWSNQVDLVETLAVTGEFARAENLAAQLPAGHYAAAAFSALAQTLALTIGDRERAQQIAQDINHPEFRTRALTAVAQAALASGDTPLARRLVALACAGGRWQICVDIVASLDHPGLVTFAEQVRSELAGHQDGESE
jgi:hypothetical protein